MRVSSKWAWIALFLLIASSNESAAEVAAVWLTQAGDAKIHVTRCGDRICGRIVWLRNPVDNNTSKPQVDDKNPNPALRERRILGLSIFSNMKPSGNNSWTGKIYNADDGKIYETDLTLEGNNTLKVRGCVGPLCGSETWSKVSNR